MSLLDTIKKILDPVGPIGQWLSPSEVYKERLGLPISNPHTMRATMAAPADVERALAPSRFVTMEEAVDVPKNRIRQVSAFVEERWSPVYQSTQSTDMVEILKASQTQIGWKVTQQQTQASRARPGAEEFIEIAQRCQIQASDSFYDGYYETIPGNDPVVIGGEVLRAQDGTIIRGGTQITKGRREYREKTKDMVHWDVGVVKERMAAQAEMDSRPVRNVQQNLERVAGQVLPMRRLVANPRTDRKSAV